MIATEDEGIEMGRKKADETAKATGRLIRVSDVFAEAVLEAAHLEKVSIADYLDSHWLAAVQKQHKDAFLKKARKLEGRER